MHTWSPRDADGDDVAALAELQGAATRVGYAHIFPPESPAPALDELVADWRAAVADPELTVVVADGNDGIWGSVAFRPDPADSDRGDLRRLHVMPDRWGSGIGAALHDSALVRMRARGWARASLWVLEANERARGIYERRGWRLSSDRKLPWPDLSVAEVRYERDL